MSVCLCRVRLWDSISLSTNPSGATAGGVVLGESTTATVTGEEQCGKSAREWAQIEVP